VNQKIHSVWLEKMFDIVVEGHCRPCERPEREQHDLNFENPLECGCRCEKVEEPLFRAGAISEAIDAARQLEVEV
jgi:hypothetical protein